MSVGAILRPWVALLVLRLLVAVLPLSIVIGRAEAAEVPRASMTFQQVRLVELARVVFGELLREDYVFDAAFVGEPTEVTVDVRSMTPDEARALVLELAKSAGFAVERVGKVWRFGRPRAADVPEVEVFFYRVKHRSVSYLADLLASLFPGGSFSFQRGAGTAPGVVSQPGVPIGGPLVNVIPGGSGLAPSGPGSAAASWGPGGQRPPSAQEGARSAAAGGGYPGGVGIAAGSSGGASSVDAKADAFVFQGTARDVERLRKLLAQVDTAAGELMVRAVVYEVRRTASEGSAIGIAADLLKGAAGGLSVSGSLGTVVPQGNSLTIGIAGFKAVVSAFDQDSRFKALSAPSLRVQSGQVARFTVGDETPVLGNVSFTQSGQAVQAVDYRPSGVIFELKPLVRDETVELNLLQQLSSFAVTTTGVNNSPTMLKRELTTTLSVKPGETIVIGGLEDARRSDDRNGLPFLPRFLDSRGSRDERVEVLLVLDVQRLGQ